MNFPNPVQTFWDRLIQDGRSVFGHGCVNQTYFGFIDASGKGAFRMLSLLAVGLWILAVYNAFEMEESLTNSFLSILTAHVFILAIFRTQYYSFIVPIVLTMQFSLIYFGVHTFLDLFFISITSGLLAMPFNQFQITKKDIAFKLKTFSNMGRFRAKRTVVFYDGECLMCNGFITKLSKLNIPSSLYFASQSGSTFQKMLIRFPDVKHLDAIVILEEHEERERILIKTNGVLQLLAKLNKFYFIPIILREISPYFADLIYDFIAANRKKAENGSCPIPPKAVRDRLLF